MAVTYTCDLCGNSRYGAHGYVWQQRVWGIHQGRCLEALKWMLRIMERHQSPNLKAKLWR